ncbi:DUF7344 domain-containing protein [Halobacterium salinarum]|uniref:DUF7344 domain-containing protein n=1 Tax=Halobacterium salinarum TaxID=2242 RepID=UPI0025553C7B|nr:hypothetical protein [Halobacterium salinarum]MDL0121709.1 hypothetical protein [Halobacterium salinarum]MDL0134724.1 hypothetical protein [Halobacterium salinarum]
MTEDYYDGSGAADELPHHDDHNVFSLLSHRRRRAIILALAITPWNRVHLRQLADVIAILEADSSRTAIPTRQITNVRTNLKRSHIPPLRTADVITQTAESGLLEPGPKFEDTLRVLGTASQ